MRNVANCECKISFLLVFVDAYRLSQQLLVMSRRSHRFLCITSTFQCKKKTRFFSRCGSEHDPRIKMHDPQMCTAITASRSVRQWSVNENAHNLNS